MELLVKPEMLTSYIYGPTFGNASSKGGVIAGHFASTFSWVFCQGGVWMAVEV